MIRTTTVITTMLIAVFMISGCAISARQKPTGVVFQTTDMDGNGLLSEVEWHDAAQKRFEVLDTNKDGNISKEEMEAGKATMKKRFKTFRSGQ